MFTSALKSFSSNIAANYTLSANTTSSSGPWKIYDATKKGSGRAVSVFVFERKSLEPQLKGLSARPGASTKRAQDEVVERLKKEANSLARLRHPSILELAEPVEELRNGNLMFATEPVTSSLSELLHEKDEQERGGGVGGRSSRYVVGDAGGRRRREVEIDELEIQKGLLQIGKGLEFLHESAGLVHGNLTPDAVYVNVKVCALILFPSNSVQYTSLESGSVRLFLSQENTVNRKDESRSLFFGPLLLSILKASEVAQVISSSRVSYSSLLGLPVEASKLGNGC